MCARSNFSVGLKEFSITPPEIIFFNLALTKGATKPAIVETGAKIMVPLFVNQGDKIKIDTRTGEYTSRA